MTKMYKIGQVLPYEPPRGLTGEQLPKPRWYALEVQPMREAATREALEAQGIHAQYPTRESISHKQGKKIVRKLPIITRVVYAQFKAAPHWDVLKRRRLITGVFSRGDVPIAIPYDVVRAVMGLPTVAEELAAAQRELLMPHPGDKADLTSGPMAGFAVDVTKVAHGRVWFETITGIKGSTTLDGVKKRLM